MAQATPITSEEDRDSYDTQVIFMIGNLTRLQTRFLKYAEFVIQLDNQNRRTDVKKFRQLRNIQDTFFSLTIFSVSYSEYF